MEAQIRIAYRMAAVFAVGAAILIAVSTAAGYQFLGLGLIALLTCAGWLFKAWRLKHARPQADVSAPTDGL
jgi:hypothetical protein